MSMVESISFSVVTAAGSYLCKELPNVFQN